MEVAYLYSKRRSEFGKPCSFVQGETQLLASIPPTDEYDQNYVLQKLIVTAANASPLMSESDVNTESIVKVNSSMSHKEGGWPKDVDFSEQSDVTRFRKKAEKEDAYVSALRTLVPIAERCMKQNNTIDVYEQFFEGKSVEYYSEPPSAKGLAVIRDPSSVKRSITSINWHPEMNSTKVAVSYSVITFQDKRLDDPRLSKSSYIWDITNTNKPVVELVPPSLLCCLRFNPKSTDTLVGGCHNGLITYFDLRKPNGVTGVCLPLECSTVEKSHHDPVSDVFWVSSKTGHQCASVATDGKLIWWDTRNLSEPLDSIELYSDTKSGGMVLGGSSLEYNSEAGPTKYLVGTEQGSVLSVNLRNRKVNNGISSFDDGPGKHHGAIYTVQRNPTHNKYFLSIGDWSAKIWCEDIRTPIITSKYHNSYLTGGCWSPTRPGVFYVMTMEGVLNVWDFYHRQNEVAYSHKIGKSPLSAIGIEGNNQSGGKFVAVGDVDGVLNVLEVCDSLSIPQNQEKTVINNMFERETRREKNLELREREMKRSKAIAEEQFNQRNGDLTNTVGIQSEEHILAQIEAKFSAILGDEENVIDDEKENIKG